MFKTFHFIERALPAKESAFLQASESWSQNDLESISVSHSDSKTRGVFFFTVLDHLPTTHKHRNTPARTQFVVVVAIHPGSSDCVFSIVWSCMYILNQLFSPSLMHVTVSGCDPTGEGLMGLLLLKPHILGAPRFLHFCMVEPAHCVCLFLCVYATLGISFMYLKHGWV